MKWPLPCALALVLASCSDASASVPASPSTPEHQLATIERGRSIPANDPLVADFRVQLDQLQPKCTEPRERLADFTVVSHRLLKEAGIDESYLTTLSAVNLGLPTMAGPLACADLFAVYVTIRKSKR
jgi:hypothetical protein